MNRPPGKYDTWWKTHQASCGGTYTKVQEPAPTKKKIDALSKKERAGRQKNKLDGWLKPKEKLPENADRLQEEDIASSGTTSGKRKAAAIS
jgi:hypothetical protein